jgi:2,3-bisphosphoglycerate-dependent phosphoglycerate mutase
MDHTQGTLLLLRHGESVFNASKTFTGLLDVGLTPAGERQVGVAARLIREAGLHPDLLVRSPMLRAIRTADLLLGALGLEDVPVATSWRLSERDYGCLTGVSKADARARHGAEAFFTWRRTMHGRPPAASAEQVASWRDPAPLAGAEPLRPGMGESLHDVVQRVRPLWDELRETLVGGACVFVVSHGNTLRALCAVMVGLTDDETEHLNIPAGHPLVFRVDAAGRVRPRSGTYLDHDAAHEAANRVAAEGGT